MDMIRIRVMIATLMMLERVLEVCVVVCCGFCSSCWIVVTFVVFCSLVLDKDPSEELDKDPSEEEEDEKGVLFFLV